MRTRSVLVDNTLGKMFTNVQKVGDATSVNLIAGTQPKLAKLSLPAAATLRVTNNLGGKPTGFSFSSTTVITKVSISVTKYATGGNIVIALKTGSTYETATTQNTFTLNALSKTVSFNTNISVTAAHNVYFDLTSVGKASAGAGLTINFTYY